MPLRAKWAMLAAIGVAVSVCACGPSNPPAADSRSASITVPVVAYATEAPHHYGSSAPPRIRHRVEKRQRQRREVQQADADWVNPPLGAGE